MMWKARVWLGLASLLGFVGLLVGETAVIAQGEQRRVTLISIENDETPQVQDDEFPFLSLEAVLLNEFNVPVPGLTAADFTLSEDGQPLSTFDFADIADDTEPLSILLLLDASGPMQEEITALRGAVITLYDVLGQHDESGVIAFRGAVAGTGIEAQEMAFTNDEGALINQINLLQATAPSGTPLYDALFRGVQMMSISGQYARRAVILITNGRDTAVDGGSGSTDTNADAAIEAARQAQVPLYTVAWGNGAAADIDFLQRAARYTGGTYRQATDPAQLAAFFADVAAQLRQKYQFSYTSALPADNVAHQVTLAVADGTEMTANFIARYPLTPQVTAVYAIAADGVRVPLSPAIPLLGTISLLPTIHARQPLAAVNYYLDDAETAVLAAATPPWEVVWQTSDVPPGRHTLFVEVIDTAVPPHVGQYEFPIAIAVCDWLCQGEQQLGFNPLFLVGGGGVVVLLLLIGLLGRRRR
ncbi:MAG: VWA domain-containing protein [Anaerolineales bacterium]|nr:VWA domain-containing protein [Anaerolineales bacterium]